MQAAAGDLRRGLCGSRAGFRISMFYNRKAAKAYLCGLEVTSEPMAGRESSDRFERFLLLLGEQHACIDNRWKSHFTSLII